MTPSMESGEFTESELQEIRALLVEKLLEEQTPIKVPASAAQRRLWFIDQLEPNSPRYNVPSVVWLAGKLNVAALEQALKVIVSRHEVLRSRFVSADGEPAQVIEQEDTDPESLQLPGLQTTFLDINTDTAKFDLTLFVADREESVLTGMEYNAEVFEASTAKAWLHNFDDLLEAVERDPAQRIAELPILSAKDLGSQPNWMPPRGDPPAWEIFHKWFAARAQRFPVQRKFSNANPKEAISMHLIPGAHETIMEEPKVRDLARAMRIAWPL